MNNQLRSDSPIPQADHGLGVPYLTYGSGRVGASITYWGGLHQVVYYGDNPMAAPSTFFQADASSAYQRLFRLQVLIDGAPYHPEFNDTRHFPFGYASVCQLDKGVRIAHHMTLLNDALVYTVDILENPNQAQIQLRLEHHDHTTVDSRGKVDREWTIWQEDIALKAWLFTVKDTLSDKGWQEAVAAMTAESGQVVLPTCATGVRAGETHMAVFSSRALVTDRGRGRSYATSQAFTQGSDAIALLFAPHREALVSCVEALRQKLGTVAAEKEAACMERVGGSPSVSVGSESVSSCFANIPATVESMIVEDAPGAMRAASMHYWVWGWDTIMCAEALLVAGNSAAIRDALHLYRDTADPVAGIGHQFTRELAVRIPQAPSAQCLYLVMLNAYYSYTGDEALVKEFYPFAKSIFLRSCESRNSLGLATGPALWPDFPECVGHTGRDCSVFNNSILYQGVRCMEQFASIAGDAHTRERATEVARELESSFYRAFWDPEREYFVDSIDSETLEQRKSYPSHAALWQSPFCGDLVGDKLDACAKFLRENHVTPRGYLPYPRWDPGFNSDYNQLGQTWPITDVFDTLCLAAAGDQEALQIWLDGVAWFWDQLTLPEAYTMTTVNDSGTPDAPGGKQPFSAKSWYMALVTSIAGVAADSGGITLGAGREQPVMINQYNYYGGKLNIVSQGSGVFPESLTVNGASITGSCKIPRSVLKPAMKIGSISIKYRRTTLPPTTPTILSLNGAALESVEVDENGTLEASIVASHPVWLRYASPTEPKIEFDGSSLCGEYVSAMKTGKVLLPCAGNKPLRLSIRKS